MPLLDYSSVTDFPFVPFTKIYSADINSMFNLLKTLLNTTKLDSTNVQAHGLTRYTSSSNLAAGTANYAVYNDANGDLTEAAALPALQGGTGLTITVGSQNPGDVVQINSTSTGFTCSAPTGVAASLRVFQFYNYG